MKKVNKFIPILLLLSLFFIASCSKDDGPGPYIPKSIVQFVNAYTNADAIIITDAYNNIVTPGYRPMFYREVAVPLLFYPGKRIINTYTGSNKLVSQATVTLTDSTYYTSLIYGNTDEANNLFVINSPIKDFDKTKSASRFIHLASNQGPVNIYLNNMETPLFMDRSVETTSGISENPNMVFTPQTSGKFDVIVADPDGTEILKSNHHFEAGNYYTLILVGDKNSETKKLHLGVIKQ